MGQRGRVRFRFGIGLAALVVLAVLAAARPAEAKYYSNSYIVEQARGEAPNVKAYVTGKEVSPKAAFSGKLGKEIELSQSGKTTVFSKTKEGVHYIVLLDNSGSVNKKQFAEVKKQLAVFRQKMKKKDKLSLYVVGTKSASGNRKNILKKTVVGNKKKDIKSDKKKIAKIKQDGGAKSKTVLYRSLNDVLAEHAAPEMRTVVLLITDGEDDSAGKNNSKQSTLKNVTSATIPVYCIMLNNQAKKPNKSKIRNTFVIMEEKNSRGYCADCSADGSVKKVKKAFTAIRKIIYENTYVVNLTAPNNKPVEGIAKLELSADKGGKVTPVPIAAGVDYSGSIPDTEAPVVGEITKAKSNAITFTITDDSGAVSGADQTANYIVKTKEEGEDGKVWNISNVNYNSVDHTVVLTFAEDLYTGEYVLTCSNIHDDTNEKNMINQSYEFTFEGISEQAEQRKEFARSYWWIVLVVIAVIVSIIIILMIKKKPGKVIEIDPNDLLKADSKLIKLTITDRTGAIKDVEWNVEGSLFIGRSEICNIYFDDERLSKQHFVIEVTKMACYIEDLESTNGTFVNGVKMTNRRMLLDGDVITAGREKFVFHVIQEEYFDKEKPENANV
ncbi:MAG: FHA domain-containing protein [Roseburia sp.]|nr:FHA domain-containing protein [Roseburia sp.]